VKILAQQLGLPLIQPRRLSEPEALAQLRQWHPDLIIVAAFGQLLRPAVLELPRFGCLNVHASLLPRWRGASPLHHAILHGDAETGVTIMQMDAGLDTGPALAARAIPITPEETSGSLSPKLAALGADLLINTLPAYLGGSLAPQPQPAQGVTHAPLLKKSDGLLDLTRPAAELERRVRAFHPWPGAFIEWQGAPLKILRTRVLAGAARPGDTATLAGAPALGTADGWLLLGEVQPAGKRPMSGRDFLNAARGWGGQA
jgi:methionyl-tRNA formyltransferase